MGMLIIKTANRATGVYRLVPGVCVWGGGGGAVLSIKTANRATDDYPLVSGNAQHQNGESSYGCSLYCLVSGNAEHENGKSINWCPFGLGKSSRFGPHIHFLK